MFTAKVKNNNDLMLALTRQVREQGKEQSSGATTVNTDNVIKVGKILCEVENPRDRYLNIPGRNNSTGAAIGETMWVLAGNNDVHTLEHFVKRAQLFSDDGCVWRGGYGARIYAYGQLQTVIDRLKANPNTRQGILGIFDPARDSNEGLMLEIGSVNTKDMICNLNLLFEVNDGKLDITVVNRSNDLLHGICSINFIEFSMIQEVVAAACNLEVGKYYIFSNNFHAYNNNLTNKQLDAMDLDAKPLVADFCNKLELGIADNQNKIRDLFSDLLDHLIDGDLLLAETILSQYKVPADSLLFDMCKAVYGYLHSEDNASKVYTAIKDDGLRKAMLDNKY